MAPTSGPPPRYSNQSESRIYPTQRSYFSSPLIRREIPSRMSEAELPNPMEWFERFCRLYNESSADPSTELGVFYERHREGVRYPPSIASSPWIEYTDTEWNQVMSVFLSRLAREQGYYQTWEWNDRGDLAWFRRQTPQRVSVVITQENQAEEPVATHDLPALAGSGADMGIMVLYPDYPHPPRSRTIEDATNWWKDRLEVELRRLDVDADFVLVTLSANCWDVPAP